MKRLSVFLYSLLLIIAISSCEDTTPDNNADLLSGTWVNVSATETATINAYLSYHFKADNQFEALLSIIDDNANEVLGYRYRGLGTYSLEGDILTLSFTEIYVNDDSRQNYSALNGLMLTDGIQRDVVPISFSEGNSLLTLHYGNCAPNESCLAEQIFRKTELSF